MYIDTHAHLNFKAFNKDLDEVIDRAKKSGIGKIIIPGAKIDSSRKAIEISQKYESCFAAVGIHPHHTEEFIKLGKQKCKEKLREILHSAQNDTNVSVQYDKIVAIGEVGLDYHQYKDYPPIDKETKSHQKELLMLQIKLAKEFNLPIIFHCRDAHDNQLDIIKNLNLTGVFHCFGGEKKHLENLLDMGFYIGFDGNITYSDSQNLQELVKFTPADRILLETDSPFLTPIPFRGKRNEPAYLTHTASMVAQIHKISLEKLSEITTQNALKLFTKMSS